LGKTLAKGFNALGWHWWPSDVAILSRDQDGRAKCVNAGTCDLGCAAGATLDPDLTDSDGIPAPKITYRVAENTWKMIAHGEDRAEEALLAAGAKQILGKGVKKVWWRAGWHQMGTCRMGDDPERSVVNGWGRCHDVKNLFIVDGSIFVTSAAVNPTSTIQALALYIGDSIKNKISNLFD